MQDETQRVAMSFKFECDVPPLLQRLAEKDNRSMTNYLEILIREKATAAKLIKKNNGRQPCE